MIVTQLKIQNLRIIENMELSPVEGLNFICGDNGAGKTSVLEALYLLGQGKSFRHAEAGPLIRNGEISSGVFSELQSVTGRCTKLGIQRDKKQFLARHSGENIKRRSELLRLLPLQLITPQSHELIERGPELRRRYLDFGLFHVEQTYHQTLVNYHRALKQRNAALRTHSIELARSFNEQMIICSHLIVRSRNYLLELINKHLQQFLRDISFPVLLELRLTQGWNKDLSLEQALLQSESKDLAQGFTGYGIHRAQLKITTNGGVASKLLSRGQQKILVYGLVVGLSQIIQQHTEEPPLLLIDDLGAELDTRNIGLMLDYLRTIGLQTFITTLDIPTHRLHEGDSVFHVEQGCLDAENKI